jgi:Terpene cyclase DEP1
MSVSRKLLCLVYAAIALLALIGTWSNNVDYLDLGLLGANQAFWTDTFVNAASRSITVDLFFLGLAVFLWMVLEARRLGMRLVWLYLVFGMLVAISVTVPIFLINRERALAMKEPTLPAGTLSAPDVIGLAVVSVAIVAYTAMTLRW